ncbi:hypothetical protein ACFSLT_01425 [Novosphingobium resinovorum]
MAQAQQAPQILVSASGTAKTAPDMATINFTLRGRVRPPMRRPPS